MRVLHVIDALGLGGGAEHSLAQSLPLLEDRGIESFVVTLTRREGGLGQQLKDAGFPVTTLPAKALPLQAIQLRAAIRDIHPDLVHATLLRSGFVSRLASIGSSVPLLQSRVNTNYDEVRVRTLGLDPRKIAALKAFDRITARLVTHFHALTSAVAAELQEELEVDAADITVIPRGRDRAVLGERTPARRQAARELLGLAPDVPAILTVGRQDLQKDHLTLVRAMPSVLARHPDAQLFIAGREGGASPRIAAAIAELDVEANVTLLGHRSDIYDLMCAADVFAFPSQYEGLGCALMEAMALGLPAVVSDAPALVEVADGGRAASIAPRSDVPELASALSGLLDAPDRAAALADRGVHRFQQAFAMDEVLDATVSMYRQLTD